MSGLNDSVACLCKGLEFCFYTDNEPDKKCHDKVKSQPEGNVRKFKKSFLIFFWIPGGQKLHDFKLMQPQGSRRRILREGKLEGYGGPRKTDPLADHTRVVLTCVA